MRIKDRRGVWTRASKLDSSLKGSVRVADTLARKEIRAVDCSRTKLVKSHCQGIPRVFRNFPVPVQTSPGESIEEYAISAIESSYADSRELYRVVVGAESDWGRMTIPRLMKHWKDRSEIVGITHLYVRGTGIDRWIDYSKLEAGNLLKNRNPLILEQEILSLVVSTAGHVTDSHSDAPDGYNHCFTGRKLWLIWDTFEGLSRGLQDVERVDVYGKAAFDIRTFSQLDSARWFVLEPGQTLFLPGNYTHKVVTLERYLGIGTFTTSLPGYLRNLVRWSMYGPLWLKNGKSEIYEPLLDTITRIATRKVRRLEKVSRHEQRKEGLFDLKLAYRRWDRYAPRSEKHLLEQNSVSTAFLDALRS